MKLLFISPMHGQSGTTSNMTVMAFIMGLVFKQKCLITQTHFAFNNLEAPIVGSNSYNIESKEYYLDVGLDALVRNFKSFKLSKSTVENCCISIPSTNVCLLPGTAKTNRESFEYEIGMVASKLFNDAEEYFDVVFIDASPIQTEISKKLIAEADLVIVNLSQNLISADLFFKTYRRNINKKIFYLFGSYDAKSKYNISNIRRRYKEINSNNSGVIPYCTGYLDSQNDCDIVNFIKNNINSSGRDEHYYFIKKSIHATMKIMKMIGIKTDDQTRI